jgi:5-hydroxyisourate hydrolase
MPSRCHGDRNGPDGFRVKLSVLVIDVAFGVPGAELGARLRRRGESGWQDLSTGRTAGDGRLELCPDPAGRGTYQLVFDLDGYYHGLGSVPLHPRAIVEFRVTDAHEDLRLALFISPHSYCTFQDSGAIPPRMPGAAGIVADSAANGAPDTHPDTRRQPHGPEGRFAQE